MKIYTKNIEVCETEFLIWKRQHASIAANGAVGQDKRPLFTRQQRISYYTYKKAALGA